MKKLLLLLFSIISLMLFSSRQFHAQNPGYYYTYDASGNRIYAYCRINLIVHDPNSNVLEIIGYNDFLSFIRTQGFMLGK